MSEGSSSSPLKMMSANVSDTISHGSDTVGARVTNPLTEVLQL